MTYYCKHPEEEADHRLLSISPFTSFFSFLLINVQVRTTNVAVYRPAAFQCCPSESVVATKFLFLDIPLDKLAMIRTHCSVSSFVVSWLCLALPSSYPDNHGSLAMWGYLFVWLLPFPECHRLESDNTQPFQFGFFFLNDQHQRFPYIFSQSVSFLFSVQNIWARMYPVTHKRASWLLSVFSSYECKAALKSVLVFMCVCILDLFRIILRGEIAALYW